MTATEQYINVLTCLKSGDLGLLRTHAGKGLDNTVGGFDLFAGLWWPLRQKNERAPRREVAWLVAKLYAACPIPPFPGKTLARQLRKCRPSSPGEQEHFEQRFDRMLALSVAEIEPALWWALDLVSSTREPGLDWVKLTNDLSLWERESTRLQWAEQFLNVEKGEKSC